MPYQSFSQPRFSSHRFMVEATIQAVEKRPMAGATFASCAMRIWFIVVES